MLLTPMNMQDIAICDEIGISAAVCLLQDCGLTIHDFLRATGSPCRPIFPMAMFRDFINSKAATGGI